MAIVKFITHDGMVHTAAMAFDKSLMQLATENGIPGIDADCGGACACGTCHVMLSPQGFALANPPKADELQMLEMTPERAETSRLACCVRLVEAMDGMVVHLPEFQM